MPELEQIIDAMYQQNELIHQAYTILYAEVMMLKTASQAEYRLEDEAAYCAAPLRMGAGYYHPDMDLCCGGGVSRAPSDRYFRP